MRGTPKHLTPTLVLVLVATLAALACDGDDPIQPTMDDARLQFVSGHQQADSVFAGPAADSLVVRVVSASGQGMAGVPVRFHASGEPFRPHMLLIRDGREFQALEDTTDASGRAAVQVAFGGPRAGYAWVRVEVPEAGLADSAFYEVLPGDPVQPAHGIFPPSPTVAIRDVTTIHAVRRDAHGNDVLVTPTACASQSPNLAVDPGCRVWGRAFGSGTVQLEHDGFARTVTVGVLPIGTLAGPVLGELVVVDLGGAIRHRLPRAEQVDWAPAGDRLVGLRGGTYGHPGHMHVIHLTGQTEELLPAFAGSLGEEAPQYSADGQWIYFSAWRSDGRAEIWRVDAQGTTPERFGPAAAAGERHRFPSPAPDGSAVVYAHESDHGASELRVIDVATRTVRSLGVAGTFPRWSRDGAWIAFWQPSVPGSVNVLVRPDGSELRVLGHGAERVDWSPDGAYLALPGGIMSASTGEVVAYGTFHGGFIGGPAWRP